MIMKNNEFVEQVKKLCSEKEMNYIDAVIKVCEDQNVEIETAAHWIKQDVVFKSFIQAEAENLNILKKTARLPI